MKPKQNAHHSKKSIIKTLQKDGILEIPKNYKKMLNEKMVNCIHSLLEEKKILKEKDPSNNLFLIILTPSSMKTVFNLSKTHRIADTGMSYCVQMLKNGHWREFQNIFDCYRTKKAISVLKKEYKKMNK